MGVIRVILAIIIGIGIADGIEDSFKKKGREQAAIIVLMTILILFEVWLIGG